MGVKYWNLTLEEMSRVELQDFVEDLTVKCKYSTNFTDNDARLLEKAEGLLSVKEEQAEVGARSFGYG